MKSITKKRPGARAERVSTFNRKLADMPTGHLFALGMTFGWDGWNIRFGDAAVIVKTPDVLDGDFAVVRTPEGHHMARAFFEHTGLRLTFPPPIADKFFAWRDVGLVGRVVGVYARAGAGLGPARPLPFALRAFDADVIGGDE